MSNQIKHPVSWNLKPLLNNDNDPKQETEIAMVTDRNMNFVNKWKNRKDYLSDSKILKNVLDEYEKLEATVGTSGDTGYYFWLRSALDQSNPFIKAKLNKLNDTENKLNSELEFFTHRLSKVPEKTQQKFLKDPNLSEYRHFLHRLFISSKYLLNEEAEKVMNYKSGTSYSNWVRLTSDLLSREEMAVVMPDDSKKKVTFAEVTSLMSEPNKTTRDSAAKAFNIILKKWLPIAEAELNSVLQDKKNNDILRNFSRPDQARHLNDDIESKVVDTLLDSVESAYDISKRFYKVKSKLMGVKKIKYHERNVPYGNLTGRKYSLDETLQIVDSVFKRLDPEFSQILNDFISSGRIDFFPGKGKEDGAFCVHFLKRQPTYVLMNFTGKYNDVITLAHEMGHAINNELMKQKQNALNFSVPMCTAEVASTFFEDAVLDEMSKGLNRDEKLSLSMMRLNDAVSSIFRQVACYRFEWDLHTNFRKKGYLSEKEIGELFSKRMSDYMGPYVEQSEGSQNWWVYWSHIRSFFYVYSYASGLLISKSMQGMVKKDKFFINKVKQFLFAGTSESPENIFIKLGVDITDQGFWKSGLHEIDRELKEVENSLGKI